MAARRYDGIEEIRVAQGTYKPAGRYGDRRETFALREGLALIGGYAGLDESNPNERDPRWYESVLSGDLKGDDQGNSVYDPSRSDNSYHVVVIKGTAETQTAAVLDGFTITGGCAAADDYRGGGGVFSTYGGGSVIRDCCFAGNLAAYNGGGLFDLASDLLIIERCTFVDNKASHGGGLSLEQHSKVRVSNCLLHGNQATYGGGLYNFQGNLTSVNCTVTGNHAGSFGGGFDGNAWIADSLLGMTLINCIVWDNRDFSGASESAQIYVSNMNIQPLVTHTCVQGLSRYGGNGNIGAAPLFVDAETGDYRLLPESPCIDAGNDSVVEAEWTDLDGGQRIAGVAVDMGAYEYQIAVAIEADLSIMPRVINRQNSRGRILARVRLPENVAIDEIDRNQALVLLPGGAAAERQYAVAVGRGSQRRVNIFAFFEVAALLEAVPENGPVEVTVTGALLHGRGFSARDTVTIIGRPTRARIRTMQAEPAPARTAVPLKAK